jgi:hypothetical protein
MSVEPLLLCREDSTYSLTIDVEVDRRVIRRKDTVGRSDNWASGHDVCCVCSVCGCRCLYVSKSEAVKGSATRVERSPLDGSVSSYPLPQVYRDPMGV